ncbi:tyrosine-type recombinase/integrase [Flavobacterium sp. I-STPA6A]|uniref:tyrosine-type recombinase/integrase n=1 Tax=Flavobacterium sp. I-STPA6A TaxID=2590450 RepID=UPI00131CED57|nr:tyrosine-type recombinase/integrase [Flavobacterium sp. I-STPA6A]
MDIVRYTAKDEVIVNSQEVTLIPTINIQNLVDAFINSQDVKLSSKNLYRRTLKQYFNWVDTTNYLLNEIARPQLLEYKDYLLSSGMSSLTVGSYITSVRRFYEWTEANKYYPNVAKGIKTPKRKQQFKKQPLLPAQATALLNFYQDKALRDYAIISLLLRTGLRTIEVIRATVEDITFKGGQRVLLIQGKGRDEKDNFVLLTDKTYKPIEDYLKTRGNISSSEPLFTSTSNNSKGDRLTTRTISYIAKEGLKAIGLDERSFTAHSLRHTTAVNILRAGGSLETAQFTLRHSNPATTQIYTATLNEERRLQNSGEALIDSLY